MHIPSEIWDLRQGCAAPVTAFVAKLRSNHRATGTGNCTIARTDPSEFEQQSGFPVQTHFQKKRPVLDQKQAGSRENNPGTKDPPCTGRKNQMLSLNKKLPTLQALPGFHP